MKVIFVYSGKGGVGKSTISYNISYYLKNKGNKVAILDSDFNAPSLHKLFEGLSKEKDCEINNFKIYPAMYESILVQSTGFLNNNQGVIWNEDFIEGALFQLLTPDLFLCDYLIIDMPPGITEVHSQICKSFPNGKVIFIISPSHLSIEDTLKAYKFIDKLDIKTLGTIINMDYFKCESCNHENKLFDNLYLNFKEVNFIKNSKFVINLPFSSNISQANEKKIPLLKYSKNCNESTKFEEIINNIEKWA